MVQPVITLPPVTEVRTRYSSGDYYKQRVRSKQKAPYNVPAPYKAILSRTVSLDSYMLDPSNISPPGSSGWPGISAFWGDPSMPIRVWANNSAYERFVSKVRQEAMLAVNFAERHQAMDMLLKRTDQLVRAASAMRRGNWRRVGEIFSSPVPPRLQKRARYRGERELANTWLEFHFGWEPMVKDIGTAIDILKGPPPGGHVRVRGAKQSSTVSQRSDNGWGTVQSDTRVTTAWTTYSANVHVSNPNVFLANQLGLINPAAVAWELVPYSFVIDWFSNVGTFLGSYTDFLGLELRNSCRTDRVDCLYNASVVYGPPPNPPWRVSAVQTGSFAERTIVVPSVRLAFRPPRPIGAVRGFTAISLLLQKLPRV